jgi:anti-anti-sigma factor
VEVRDQGRGTVLRLFGELDLASSPALEEELQKVSARQLIVVDLRELEFIDSTGLSVLVKAHQRARELGHQFGLVKGAGQVQRLLGLTGLADRLTIADLPEELLSS